MTQIRSVAFAERRRHPRAAARVSVGLQIAGQVVMAHTRDFSSSGVFIETGADLKLGDELSVFLMPARGTEAIKLHGTVQRLEGSGVGVEFRSVEGRARTTLDAFLSSLEQEPEPALTPAPGEPEIPDEYNPAAIEAAFQRDRQERATRLELAKQVHESARRALDSGRWTQAAIVLLERAIELSPGVAAFHHDLGTAYYQFGDVTRAVKEFELALQLLPEADRN